MADKKMLLAMQLGNGYGSQAHAWQAQETDLDNYTNFQKHIQYAQAAERGKFQFIFMPDTPANSQQNSDSNPQMSLDPVVTMAAMATATKNIGFVATGSTTYNEPYNLARQYKALDHLSRGRIGWNAVTSVGAEAAANFGVKELGKEERYERAHEFIQIVQALWGSWEEDAWVADRDSGIFADMNKIRPVNLAGRHVGSAGPLPIPPSPQGQPVIFQAGGSPHGLAIAGRYANGVIGNASTIDDAVQQRRRVREAAERFGRNPDDIKFFAGIMPTIAPTVREALDSRGRFVEPVIGQRVGYLGMMLGIHLDASDLDSPLSVDKLASAHPSPADPRSQRAYELAREGWSVRDILYHAVIDYHPAPMGPAVNTADHLQEWFEAGAADGFWLSPTVYESDIDAFVDGVVPILQERGLFHTNYEGTTLRKNLGVPYQYGLSQPLN